MALKGKTPAQAGGNESERMEGIARVSLDKRKTIKCWFFIILYRVRGKNAYSVK